MAISEATVAKLFIELAKLGAVLLKGRQPVKRVRDLRTSEEAKQRVDRARRAALRR
jgi:hypothetical protein